MEYLLAIRWLLAYAALFLAWATDHGQPVSAGWNGCCVVHHKEITELGEKYGLDMSEIYSDR